MIIRTDKLQPACSKLLPAVDSSAIAEITDVLELKTIGQTLCINATNREYYAQVRLNVDSAVDFKATVNAGLFLKLIAQITSETIELIVNGNTLTIKANGTYDLPLLYENDAMMELPEIVINNPTTEMTVDGTILQSILNFNSKELMKDVIATPLQKMYYIDQAGCITFTTGACVNNFRLEQPIKILLNGRLVKLFKLFGTGKVKLTLGYDALSETIIQTKLKLENDEVSLTSILSCDDTMINQVPAEPIRARVNNIYPYNVTVNKNQFIETINRLLLFSANADKAISSSNLLFEGTSVKVFDVHGKNVEQVNFKSGAVSEPYSAKIVLTDLKHAFESTDDEFVTLSFGDHEAFVIVSTAVKHVVPESEDI